MRPLLQLVVLQMKFLGDAGGSFDVILKLHDKESVNEGETSYLGNFPPVKTIKEVVGSPLVGVGLECGLHARCSCYPNPLLFVVPPIPVKAGNNTF